jgi:Ohr subfamily peroxiredoxin
LFAAGYSACFGGAIGAVAAAEKVKTGEVTVTADVTLHIDPGPHFYISVKLAAKIDGVDHATAEKLVHKAHEVCPYSKATRNNVKVELSVL